MGPDILDERDRPKKNEWVETGVSEGRFGKEGAALESIAAGGLHSVFIDERGTVWTCGVNDAAALGRETTDIPDPDNPGSFLDIDDLTSYPHPLQSLVDEDFRAVQVVAGDSINAAISAEGELRVWGSFRAKEGSLGFSTSQEYQFKPTPVNLDLIHKSGDYEKISSIACGGNHIMALTTHGHIFTWGTGEQGQLGRKVFDSHKLDGTTPRKIVLGTRRRKATVVGAGSFHSLAVDEAGEVWGWGLNTMGQLGNGTVTEIVEMPERVPALSKHALGGHTIVKIAGGEHHTLFLTSDGKVYSCGRSNGGQLGLADDHPAFKDREDPNYLAEPTLVSMPDQDDPAVQISCGVHNCLVITESGAMYAWGQGLQGELGVPDEVVKTPRVIVRREGGQWSAVDVSCGGQHTMGLFRKKTN
ncbi:RCC1/BLIP-II protein [Fistulina hepatica ATCC 64428]|nr:RCC1/BLIP-II protein [Fistulina hepatica ATCC 64428]